MDRTRPAHGATVLHVVESLGGGVLSAMRDYLRSTPTLRHLVLARTRPGDHTGESFDGLAEAVVPAPARLDHAIRTVNHTYRRFRPDIVHAHSSYGGAWARLSRVPGGRVVYTPHCFAFERRDLPRATRAVLRGAERILARRTAHLAGVAPREVTLGRRLRPTQPATYVPNVVRVDAADDGEQAEHTEPSRPPVLVGAGRLCPQKDPAFFHLVATHIRAQQPDARVRWIGGGDPDAERALRAAGVEVTGWVDRPVAMRAMAQADVYLHTAAWEGAPISVLEAAALGVPIAARRIPSLESLAVPALAEDPAELARTALAMTTGDARRVGLEAAADLRTRHRPQQQHAALMDVYDAVVRANPAPPAVPVAGAPGPAGAEAGGHR